MKEIMMIEKKIKKYVVVIICVLSMITVSYTHLDVYKRQIQVLSFNLIQESLL